MSSSLTRREFLTRAGMAVAAIETLDHLDPCCAFAADARTADKDLFELKPVADGIYAAISIGITGRAIRPMRRPSPAWKSLPPSAPGRT